MLTKISTSLILAGALASGLALSRAQPIPIPAPVQDPEPVPTCWALIDPVVAGCEDCTISYDKSVQHGPDCSGCGFTWSALVTCPEDSSYSSGATLMACNRANQATANCPGGGVAVAFFMMCSTCQYSNPWP